MNPRRVFKGATGSLGQGVLLGLGLALGATLLKPENREKLRPLLLLATAGALELKDELVSQATTLREGMEDIVAEARVASAAKKTSQEDSSSGE